MPEWSWQVSDELTVQWKKIRDQAGPYPPEAYEFVRDGLQHTVELVHGKDAATSLPSPGENRHVTGQQLCMGLRDYAIQQYGRLAMTVLNHWHISRTGDFGRMVFAMIDGGLMSRSDEDNIDDFADIYEFDEAFSPAEFG
jgi:uncharacterized repeat protein (TIGR04138 family)